MSPSQHDFSRSAGFQFAPRTISAPPPNTPEHFHVVPTHHHHRIAQNVNTPDYFHAVPTHHNHRAIQNGNYGFAPFHHHQQQQQYLSAESAHQIPFRSAQQQPHVDPTRINAPTNYPHSGENPLVPPPKDDDLFHASQLSSHIMRNYFQQHQLQTDQMLRWISQYEHRKS